VVKSVPLRGRTRPGSTARYTQRKTYVPKSHQSTKKKKKKKRKGTQSDQKKGIKESDKKNAP
jgi:hypothetical protein